jgi:ribonuclease P protein component
MTPRATFPKKDRLSLRRDFDLLLAEGTSLHTKGLKLICFRLPPDLAQSNLTSAHAQHAFALPKRHFKRATVRNHYRRRIREAVRLRQGQWLASLQHAGQYACLWVGDGRLSPRFQDIDQQVARLLQLAIRTLNTPQDAKA